LSKVNCNDIIYRITKKLALYISLMRQVFKEGWIENIDVWKDLLRSRNATAHVKTKQLTILLPT
jgi:hypothetical protein